MTTQIQRAANFLFKFHVCALKSISVACENPEIRVNFYPIMDGIYIASPDLQSLKTVINKIFKDLSEIFISERELKHQFIIRGAIAFGPVIHGNSISKECCGDLFDNPSYKEKLLLGMPVSQCYSGERNAPPFGVYTHDSAIAFGKLSGRFYSWWDYNADSELIRNIKSKVDKYFDWCRTRKYSLGMETDKIEKYNALSTEYFVVG